MKDKNMTITISLTFLLFSFVFFLIYTIYCYAYYNPHQEIELVSHFNKHEYKTLYNNFYNNDISFEDFMIPINIMYNKDRLLEIYNKYYNYSNITEQEFLNTYYYDDASVKRENIEFIYEGKTNLLKRRKTMYEKIHVKNRNNHTSTIGLLNNINISVEDNSELKIDNKYISCSNNNCLINKIYGGIHEVIYISNNNTYYGLININNNDITIDISLIDYLIKIS